MVKKSEIDRLRDEFFQREMKRRNALKGPFRCPKCQEDNRLQCRAVPKQVKEIKTPEFGDPFEVTSPYTDYRFFCIKRTCQFNRIITKRREEGSIIDVYNTLYDEEISPGNRETQVNMIHDRKYRTITLQTTEVRMK